MNEATGEVAVIIPSFNEAERIAATVRAAASIPGVAAVIVVDDGSHDQTEAAAAGAGATVVRHARNRGKAASMVTGARAAPAAAHLLFLDADLGASAAQAGALVRPVRSGDADVTIAQLPPPPGSVGGHGIVVGLARRGILRRTGWHATQPLSGQRCLTRAAFDAALPLAARFGVETAMTIDLVRAGFRVVEVPVPLSHRWSGTTWRDELHRARQLVDVALALLGRRSAR
jgi:glycosyltransferase involved in cell wall biosynthesis